ncbi:four helix bundle protein [Verrucomicrobiales bacterium BCK34]|nr:four helix bundle protein [Verrucomicrobiales bacterium BCK34]
MNRFDHEKLNVYQQAIEFVAWVTDLLEAFPRSMAAHDQLDRASTSVPLNIAEGNGKFTPKDRCKYFDTARGSALECAACLDVLVAKRKIDSETAAQGKARLFEVVSMLVGLIRSNSPDRNV